MMTYQPLASSWLYYYIDRSSGEDAPMIGCSLETPDEGDPVLVYAHLKDGKKIDSAISILSGMIIFS